MKELFGFFLGASLGQMIMSDAAVIVLSEMEAICDQSLPSFSTNCTIQEEGNI